MPKTRRPVRREDVPIWDELVAERGDPRPYDPTVVEFTPVTQPAEPLVDDAGFDDASSALDDDVRDLVVEFDYQEAYALALLNVTEDEFRERHGLPARPIPRRVVEHDPTLDDMLDRTVVLPVATNERTVRLASGEVRWPS